MSHTNSVLHWSFGLEFWSSQPLFLTPVINYTSGASVWNSEAPKPLFFTPIIMYISKENPETADTLGRTCFEIFAEQKSSIIPYYPSIIPSIIPLDIPGIIDVMVSWQWGLVKTNIRRGLLWAPQSSVESVVWGITARYILPDCEKFPAQNLAAFVMWG